MKALAFESDNFARITTCNVNELFISAGRGNSLKFIHSFHLKIFLLRL